MVQFHRLLALGAGLWLVLATACSVEVREPIENGKVVIQAIGPAGIGKVYQGRVSMQMDVVNGTNDPVELSRVEIDGNVVSNFAAPKPIQPGGSLRFQNCRCKESVPLVIDAPFPSTMQVAAFFVGADQPAVASVPVTVHLNDGGPLRFPADAADLRPNEAWGGGSDHASGHQVFGLDMGVLGWNGSWWTETFPGTSGAQRHHYRIYGMPVHAMADGTVCHALNDHEEMSYIGQDTKTTTSPSFGGWHGAGNHLYIKTDTEIALYAHLQPGSIPPELLVPGAQVHRGQYLGKVGYSGNSSHPHLHIHEKEQPAGGAPSNDASKSNHCDSGAFRPMMFDDVYSLTKGEADSLMQQNAMSPADWAPLTNHSAPHPYSLLFPSRTAPSMDAELSDSKQYIGVMRSGNHIEYRVKAPGWTAFTNKWAKLSDDDFRLKEIETVVENGERQFIGIFERGTDAHAFVGHPSWQAFTQAWATFSNQGLRLVDIDVYRVGNQVHYLGVFRQGGGGYALYSITGWKAFTQAWDKFSKQGLRLVDLDIYPVGNDQQYVGVFRQGNDGYALYSITGWSAFTEAWDTFADQGLRLIDVETFEVGNSRQYVGVFRAGTDGYSLFSITGYENFVQLAEQGAANGLRMVDVHVEQ